MESCCSHLQIKFSPIDNGDGLYQEQWVCETCGCVTNNLNLVRPKKPKTLAEMMDELDCPIEDYHKVYADLAIDTFEKVLAECTTPNGFIIKNKCFAILKELRG